MNESTCASVNGVPLHAPGERLDAATLRQRACIELLRQAARTERLLDANDEPMNAGSTDEGIASAIEALIARDLALPDITEDACRRYHTSHMDSFTVGARVHAWHILFALGPETALEPIRQRAETCLLDLRTGARQLERFAGAAQHLSNYPSGQQGGDLGWLTRADCAPEFAKALFDNNHVGVLPQLVRSRFGFHVVRVMAREAGRDPGFESVRPAVEARLRAHAYAVAVSRHLQSLAEQAILVGVAIGNAESPYSQ